MTGESPFYKSNLKGSIALIIGSEGKGMGRLVTDKCDFIVNIPMVGSISSLNAGVAAGIVMYEIFRQRNSDKK
jgi:23S rRNA (guanosine2251-2'-O)-methyltransferase